VGEEAVGVRRRGKREVTPPTVRNRFPLVVLYFSIACKPRRRMGDPFGSFIGEFFFSPTVVLHPILSIGLHLDQSMEIVLGLHKGF
jgi:hypothetical protein